MAGFLSVELVGTIKIDSNTKTRCLQSNSLIVLISRVDVDHNASRFPCLRYMSNYTSIYTSSLTPPYHIIHLNPPYLLVYHTLPPLYHPYTSPRNTHHPPPPQRPHNTPSQPQSRLNLTPLYPFLPQFQHLPNSPHIQKPSPLLSTPLPRTRELGFCFCC